MSFDDLIRIFLILFFIVIPIMRTISRNQQRPPTAGRPRQPPAGRPPAQTGQDPSGPATVTSSAEAEFQKKLEEARRRVQEAAGSRQASAQPVPAQRSTSPVPPPPRPASTPPQTQPAFPPVADRQTPTAPMTQARPQPTFMPRAEVSEPLEVSKPLEVERRPRTKKTQVIRPASQASFVVSQDSVVQGIIWNQILSEPRAKRSWRAVSRRP